MLALKTQLAVGIILNDGDAEAVGQQNEFVAAAFGKRCPARVLEVGQNVHELGPRT